MKPVRRLNQVRCQAAGRADVLLDELPEVGIVKGDLEVDETDDGGHPMRKAIRGNQMMRELTNLAFDETCRWTSLRLCAHAVVTLRKVAFEVSQPLHGLHWLHVR